MRGELIVAVYCKTIPIFILLVYNILINFINGEARKIFKCLLLALFFTVPCVSLGGCFDVKTNIIIFLILNNLEYNLYKRF